MDARSALPIGPPVDAHAAPRPERRTLAGQYVDIVPIDAEAHGEALFSRVAGTAHDALWTYLADGPFRDRPTFDEWLRARQRSDDPLFYAIVDKASRQAVGSASLMRIDPPNRVIEVGHILYTAPLQRTRGATEAMFLFARYVFEDLGYRRYEWKCHALNTSSRAAALRLGFTFEGLFRQHSIVKGRNRDTAWFSMLDSEWPVRKARFERWLAPQNFNAEGHQIAPLGKCGEPPEGHNPCC